MLKDVMLLLIAVLKETEIRRAGNVLGMKKYEWALIQPK